MGEPLRVLLAEDSRDDAELVVRELRRAGFEPEWRRVDTEADYKDALSPDLDVILCDYEMPQFDAPSALRILREQGLDIPLLIVSGTIGEDTAVAAMKLGASDYLIKDRLARLGTAVRQALEQTRQRRENRAATEAIRRAEESIRVQAQMLDHIGQAVIATTPDGNVIFANRFAQELYGWSQAEILGKSILDVTVTEAGREEAGRIMARLLEGKSWSGEFLVRRGDGSTFPAFVTNTPFLDRSGEITAIIGISTDITERKRAERRQAAQHAVTRVLAESPSLSAAAPGILQAICESVGGRFGALWEIDRQVRLLRCKEVWLAPEMAAEALVAQTNAASFASGVGLAGRVWSTARPLVLAELSADPTFLRATGAGRAGLSAAIGLPVSVRGEVLGVIECLGGPEMREPEPDLLATLAGIGTQIGQFIEHRGAEQQLLQAQKMEAVGQLAGGIAHDFNNLLGVILGYAELASREVGAEHRTQRRLEAIRKAAERAVGLTRQILTFSRKQTVETRICDVNAIVEGVETMLRRLIGEDIRLAAALGEGVGRVRADPGQMEQVLMNLCVNARDAMPSGGRLVIETADVDLDESYTRGHREARPGPHVMIAVSDTGVGMTSEVQARIFEPFFTTKEAGKGTGLGLAVVYGIMKQSGGSLSVYSEPGSGTTFKVYFPRVRETEAKVTASSTVAARGGSETILLVEDEEALRAIVAETLREAGYTVLEAPEPQAALVLAGQSEHAIHLLITDVVLPGQSGPASAVRIRNAQPNARVLLMSGYTDRLLDANGVVEPGTPFLSKPFTIDALLRKVREVLDHDPPAKAGPTTA